MVIHDYDTKRTADNKLVIKESLSGELRDLEVGSFKNPEYTGEKIPFLEEVIETIPEGKVLVIEVKSDDAILPFLTKMISTSPKEKQCVVISFDYEIVKGIKKLLPGTPTYWLNMSGNYKAEHIKMAEDASLEGLNFHHRGISGEFVSSVHNAGLEIFAWTVDNPKDARRLVEIGIDGITTNRPAWLKEQINLE